MISVAIVGPESTGKTTLAEALAIHYKTVWVPEYAREFLNARNGYYKQHDLLKIAKGQLKSVEEYRRKAGKLIFLDTDLFVIKVWSQVKFGHCNPWILQQLEAHQADLYLLTYFDIPYEADPLREHPKMRPQLFEYYERELNHYGANYRVVRGNATKRLKEAIKNINPFIIKFSGDF